MTTTDPHGRAIAVITRALARCREDGADDEVAARHILANLEGMGWRRVIEPPPPASQPVDPVTNAVLAAKARAAIRHHP